MEDRQYISGDVGLQQPAKRGRVLPRVESPHRSHNRATKSPSPAQVFPSDVVSADPSASGVATLRLSRENMRIACCGGASLSEMSALADAYEACWSSMKHMRFSGATWRIPGLCAVCDFHPETETIMLAFLRASLALRSAQAAAGDYGRKERLSHLANAYHTLKAVVPMGCCVRFPAIPSRTPRSGTGSRSETEPAGRCPGEWVGRAGRERLCQPFHTNRPYQHI